MKEKKASSQTPKCGKRTISSGSQRTRKLVIVESPAKARTLSKILGRGYTVRASVGHVRDLPKSSLGVDVENSFEPHYIVPREKKATVRELQELAGSANVVYLATDPDREGEAISWHLVEAANLEKTLIQRVVFHSITADGVKEGFLYPREIDTHLVDAQQARRILDRLVGYNLSPLLWRKVARRLSAGRVQSVALRLIVEREQVIEDFTPQEYWTIETELSQDDNELFKARLISLAPGKRKLEITKQPEAESITQELRDSSYLVFKVSEKETQRQPTPPFITSTLQQEAWRKLHFTARRTMAIAQQLYEGLPLGEEGATGLITYMRTDSTQVVESAIKDTRDYIREKFGKEFLPSRPRQFTKKVMQAQEAHEAIRPTKVSREPSQMLPYLGKDQAKLYELIWKRMIASQMSDARFHRTTVDITATTAKGKVYLLRATGIILKFPGFLTLYQEGREDEGTEEEGVILPPLKEKEQLTLKQVIPLQHFTQPPPRYNEASLIKMLEEKGIGRPSTYAPIISTLQGRGYVQRKEGRLYPQEIGLVVNGLLVKHFNNIVNVEFTVQLEDRLDQIAQGEMDRARVIRDFYVPFKCTLDKADREIEKITVPDQLTGELCPLCGKPMVIKRSRYGQFIGCSGFPECRSTKPLSGKTNPRRWKRTTPS